MTKWIVILLLVFSTALNAQQETLTLDSAIHYYQKLLEKNKNSAFGSYGMASAMFTKKEYQQAIQYSNTNLGSPNEHNEQSYLIKGISQDLLGMPEDAIATFDKALKQFPDNYQLHYNCAFSCYKIQNFEKATFHLQNSLRLSPAYYPNYQLQACILFEKENNKNLIYYLLYSMLFIKNKENILPIVYFLSNFQEKKIDNINIPYFEKRYKIEDVNALLEFYSQKNKKQDVNFAANDLPHALISSYDFIVEKNSVLQNFYDNLKKENLQEAYVNFCFRLSGIEYIENWLKNNPSELTRLANFLEQNMRE